MQVHSVKFANTGTSLYTLENLGEEYLIEEPPIYIRGILTFSLKKAWHAYMQWGGGGVGSVVTKALCGRRCPSPYYHVGPALLSPFVNRVIPPCAC